MNGSTTDSKIVIHVMFVFLEGPRAVWILAAEHPAAASTDSVSAPQWSHSHTAAGEGRSHSSRCFHTHTGTMTSLLITDCCNSTISNLHICKYDFNVVIPAWSRPCLVLWLSGTWSDTQRASFVSGTLTELRRPWHTKTHCYFTPPSLRGWTKNDVTFCSGIYSPQHWILKRKNYFYTAFTLYSL